MYVIFKNHDSIDIISLNIIVNMKKIRSFEETVKLFREIHGYKFEYYPETYHGSAYKMKIHCNICGCDFEQTPNKHLLGRGCPECGGTKVWDKDKFVKETEKIFPKQFSFDETNYVNQRTPLIVTCKKHGNIEVIPKTFLKGCGCPYCKEEKNKKIADSFEERARKIHPVEECLDYGESRYVNIHTPLKIICHKKDEYGVEHGEFWQTPAHHLSGQGCPKCNGNFKMTGKEFEVKAKKIHQDKFTYFSEKYNGYNENTEIKCNTCGKIFFQTPHNHLKGEGCPYCVGKISKPETDIAEFISQYTYIDTNNRKILDNSKEIDILIPDKKIAFEYDGLVWHSEKFGKDRNYHLNKTEECKNKGIKLYHIFEDEWVFNREIVESRIKNILGVTENKIHARKCCIREISDNDAKIFLNNNHIQGYCKSKYRYGLFYNNELVSVMTFGHLRKNLGSIGNNDEYELLRFCNKLDTTVTGGASRLLKCFINKVQPNRIISYADKRWSTGNLYEKLGFKHVKDSQPGYFYIIGQRRENRFKYRKDKLVKEGYDKNKTEHEIMIERGIYRIYDCGMMVFEMIINNPDE